MTTDTEFEELKAKFNAVIAEQQAQIDALKRATVAPIESKNPVIAQTSEIVALLTALKGVIPQPPPPPSILDQLKTLEMLDKFRNGESVSGEGETEEGGDSGFLHDILQLAKMQQKVEPAPAPIPKTPQERIEEIVKKDPEGELMPPASDKKTEFQKYADAMIAELKKNEIDALKLAPKEMIKIKLKSAHPEMSDSDFEYAYKKVLAL